MKSTTMAVMPALLAAASMISAASDHRVQGLSVTPVSPRAGFVFTDSEPVDIRAKVSGLTAPASVDCRLTAIDGNLEIKGRFPVPRNAVEVPLPLEIRGRRGLYTLSLTLVCGEAQANASTPVAIVFTPDPPDEASPWGVFYIPLDERRQEHGAADIAISQRLLGASWARFNFWAGTFGKVSVTSGNPPSIGAEWPGAKAMVRALREQGIFIMGEVAQCPRELSSRPDDTKVAGDAGPVFNRVKPADYALWDQLMTKLADDFRNGINVWEIWNEPDLPDLYWTGTAEGFAELVHHTAAALRLGNPDARIAGPGFSACSPGSQAFADRLFQLGLGKDLDILTVHYTDDAPDSIAAWVALMKKYHLNLPLWNSEERSDIPLRNLAGPIARSFKFTHASVGYAGSTPLVNRDLTARPAGLAFSVGAHCIGSAKHTAASKAIPGYETHFFRRGEETIAAFENRGNLFGVRATATLAVEPLQVGMPVTLTDLLGRSTELQINNDRATLDLKGTCILNGARRVEIINGKAGEPIAGVAVAEAEAGSLGPGWQVNPHEGFSGAHTADIWAKDEPGPAGYWIEVTLAVPTNGSYEVLFSGNNLARLNPPRSLSPFSWQIDGGESHVADKAPPVTTGVPGAPEGLALLGKADLKAGAHTFRLKLIGRRDQPDNSYALWFDAIALRKQEP